MVNVREDQSVMKRIITRDETWICVYEPETIAQSREYRAKVKQEPRQGQGDVKFCSITVV